MAFQEAASRFSADSRENHAKAGNSLLVKTDRESARELPVDDVGKETPKAERKPTKNKQPTQNPQAKKKNNKKWNNSTRNIMVVAEVKT